MPGKSELVQILNQMLQLIGRFKGLIHDRAYSSDTYERLFFHHIFEEEEHHENAIRAAVKKLSSEEEHPDGEVYGELIHLLFNVHNFLEHLKISQHEGMSDAEQETLQELFQKTSTAYETMKEIRRQDGVRPEDEAQTGEAYRFAESPVDRDMAKEAATQLFHESPLTADEREQLESVVEEQAGRQRVARQFLTLFGPVGEGIQSVTNEVFTEVQTSVLSLLGEESNNLQEVSRKEILTIPLITSDFILYWRDVAQARTLKHAIDYSAASLAAVQLAYREDELIFHGSAAFNIPGVLTVDGRITHIKRDWLESGNAFADVVDARGKLLENHHTGPFALVVSPRLYGLLHRVHHGTNVLEIEHVRSIMTAGVYQSQVLKEDQGAVLDVGRHNLDLVVSETTRTVFLDQNNLNYLFRIYEGIAPRIKRPSAICTLESLQADS